MMALLAVIIGKEITALGVRSLPVQPAYFHTHTDVRTVPSVSTGLVSTKTNPPPYFIVVQSPVLKKDGNFYLEDI